ncbi:MULTISPECIES: tape measure protein [unclassified Pseudomonas]|uniref:tape measure protein n=1 Tax=unclassified Pseudomonas TaxID=196821 RepID=UPI0039B752E5
MSMTDQALANLFATIGFKVDLTGIKKVQQLLKATEKQAIATGRAIDKALKGTAGRNANNLVAAQKAATKEQFAQQLQNAKLTKIQGQTAASNAASGLKTQQQQVALAIKQQKLAATTQATQAAAAKQALQQQALTLANQIKQHSLTNRNNAAAQQHQLRQLRIQAAQLRANRQTAGLSGNGFHGYGGHGGGGLLGIGHKSLHGFGGIGRFAGGVAGGSGAVIGLEGLAGGLGRASTGLGAVAGSSALVVAAFAAINAAALGYAREAERASNTRSKRLGQFESVGSRTPENAQRMNNRFENFAQTEGLSTRELGDDYAKIVGALSPKVGVDKAADTTEGIFRYGKAQHLSNENMSKISLGMRQALGKGQLFSEEWTGQIAEHLGAHANEFGAEAWQRASGGKLTGDAAMKAFSKDRQDKKISGDALTKFMLELGQVLNQHANDGGLLDKARNTQDSWDNRIANQYQANMVKAYDNTGLHDTMTSSGGLYDSFLKFMNELQPQFVALGSVSNSVLEGLTGVVKGLTSITAWFNSSGSYFDPKFTQDMGNAFAELGQSLSTLWNTVSQILGLSEEAGVFKTSGEVVIGVITSMVDVFTILADAVIGTIRLIQDALHTLPDSLGGISDDSYAKILAQRQVDDKKRADIQAARELDRFGGGPAPQSNPSANVDPNAPWRLTDGSDIPTLDNTPKNWRVTDGSDIPVIDTKAIAAMSQAPITNPVQPALNGKALAPTNVTNNITLNQAPINISGVDSKAAEQALEKHRAETQKQIDGLETKLSPSSNGYQARGN